MVTFQRERERERERESEREGDLVQTMNFSNLTKNGSEILVSSCRHKLFQTTAVNVPRTYSESPWESSLTVGQTNGEWVHWGWKATAILSNSLNEMNN